MEKERERERGTERERDRESEMLPSKTLNCCCGLLILHKSRY